MLLSARDITVIQRLGYEPTYFVEEHNGWLQLKNTRGKCVFHTGEHCVIYNHRPAGCRLYPVVFNADSRRAIIDADCPQRHHFRRTTKHTQALTALITTLRRERAGRTQHLLRPKKS